MKKIFTFILITSLGIYACVNSENSDSKEKPDLPLVSNSMKTKPSVQTLDSLIEVKIQGHFVTVLSPPVPIRGNIIALPGWNFPRQDWCEKSSLCQKALSQGYRLILPEMAKSIYSTQLYPETRSDWRGFPTLKWLSEEAIPYLQDSLSILNPNEDNYVLGLSTGGRGVAMLILELPELFQAGAALSGDFEPTAMPQDRLMIGYLGSYADFPQRWEGENNPCTRAEEFKTPLYLGHGRQDAVVPVQQSQLFYQALQKASPDVPVLLHLTEAKHDYAYWDSEVEAMLDFFAKYSNKK